MKVEVLGVKIDALRKSEVMTQISGRLQRGEQTFIVTPYSESLVAAQKDTEYREVLNSADFVLPDGVGVLWAAHFLKRLATGDERSGLSKFGLLVGTLVSVIFRPDALHDPIPEKISGASTGTMENTCPTPLARSRPSCATTAPTKNIRLIRA